MEARAVLDGERKTITALFADFKGSMSLIEDLDPEEARAIVDPALTLMMEAVHRYEGYVVQSTGDGIFAFFGAPIAHEDHPQRALYTVLLMQEESKRFAETLRELGYPDQALKRSQEVLTFAHEFSHPFSLAWASVSSAWFHQFRREVQLVQEQAEAAIALSTEQGFSSWLAWGTILRGWALAEQGRVEEGIAQIHQSLVTFRATEIEFFRSYRLALLAEAYGKVGQIEEGLSVLAQALAAVNRSGECWHEAELYRLKGTLTLQSKVQGPKSQVEKETEGCFLQAIEIAHRQQAKSLELRAVMSLARLWQQQGKKEEARRMLAEIYGWFTEGFDTADLKEAKALLEELRG